MAKKSTDWHSHLTDLLRFSLTPLGLQLEDHVKLGKMPLEADLVIITLGRKKSWKQHPLWQELTHINVVEFKSVTRPLRFGDFEKMLAYTLLYRMKHKIPYTRDLGAWLLIPQITTGLRRALSYYGIELKAVLPGFWRADLLFPLHVVEYDYLPNELPYAELKLFAKSGKPVQEVLRLVLQSEQDDLKVEQIFETAKGIHPEDLEVLLNAMGKSAAHKSLEKTLLELTKEYREQEVQQAEQRAEQRANQASARQMKADKVPVEAISRYTGLSADEIAEL